MNEYLALSLFLGVLFGIALVCILLIVTKKDGKIKCKYDERQTAVREKAYRISFYVLMIYNVLYGMCGMVVDKMPIDNMTAMMVGVCIALIVHITFSIWKDAYFSLNEDKGKLMITFVIIGILNLLFGIINLIHGKVIVDGVITFRCINLICALLFIIVFFVLFLKNTTRYSQDE